VLTSTLTIHIDLAPRSKSHHVTTVTATIPNYNKPFGPHTEYEVSFAMRTPTPT
jgi:hypothetical protein